MIKEKLQELAGIVFDLNNKTEQCWFLSIKGHTDSVEVYYGDLDMWFGDVDEEKNLQWITMSCDFSELDELIQNLKEVLDDESKLSEYSFDPSKL